MGSFSKEDEKFMRLALTLAARGRVSPNPLVGAVLVRRQRVLAEAFHERFGGFHAEKLALERARMRGKKTRGAVLYATLEPCVDFEGKKTPSCADALAQAGISRAVIAMADPNPKVCGRGIAHLKKAGVRVEVGCLEAEARELNAACLHRVMTRRPLVSLKVAMSLDGKIATRLGESRWITGEAARSFVKKLRDRHDAVLVGAGTVLADDPELAGRTREPIRIILDSRLRTPLRARVLRDTNVLCVTTRRAPARSIAAFQKRGLPLKIFPRRIDLPVLLHFLAEQGVTNLLVEGGAEVFGSFLDARCADRLFWFVAPLIIGGRQAVPAVSGKGVAHLIDALQLKNFRVTQLGSDILFEAALRSDVKRSLASRH